MTAVQMIASAGPFLAGERYDMDDRRARNLIRTGYARPDSASVAIPRVKPDPPAAERARRSREARG